MTTKPTSLPMFQHPDVASRYREAEDLMRPFARALVQQSGASLAASQGMPLRIFDNACGTGIVSSMLYEALGESVEGVQLLCGDTSDGMVEYVQKRIVEQGWSGAEARKINAQDTQLPNDTYTHVLTSFGAQLFPDPDAFLNECFRILQPAGKCSLTTWEAVGWYADFAGAVDTIPDAPPVPSSERVSRSWSGKGEWDRQAYVKEQLQAHGFVNVQIEKMPGVSRGLNATAVAQTLGPMLESVAKAIWSEAECMRLSGLLQPALERFMQKKYGDGEIVQQGWMAIVATGTKPS